MFISFPNATTGILVSASLRSGYGRLMRPPILTYECSSSRFCRFPFGAETFSAIRLVKGGEGTHEPCIY